MDATLRNSVRERWLRALFEFIDIGYQKRVWLEAFYPDTTGSYTEALCMYFDDLDLNEGYDGFVSKGFVTAQEAFIVSEFHNALDNYTTISAKDDFGNGQALSDHDWHSVVLIGFTTWQQLKTQLRGTHEYGFMQQLEEKYL